MTSPIGPNICPIDFRQNNCPPIPGQVWIVCLWRSNTFGNHGDSLGSGQTFNTTTISHLQDNDNNSTTSKTSSAQLELIREDLVYRSVVSYRHSLFTTRLTGCPNTMAQILLYISYPALHYSTMSRATHFGGQINNVNPCLSTDFQIPPPANQWRLT